MGLVRAHYTRLFPVLYRSTLIANKRLISTTGRSRRGSQQGLLTSRTSITDQIVYIKKWYPRQCHLLELHPLKQIDGSRSDLISPHLFVSLLNV